MPAALRTLLTVVAAVLALVGIVGVASGAADDGEDVSTAQDQTTTTFAGSDTTLPGETTTSVAGGTATTTNGGSPGTTARPSGPATTVAALQSDACGAPPAATSNPGPIVAPAVGVYSYVSCDDPAKSQDTTVRPGKDGGGKLRREISAAFGGFNGTLTVAYGGGVVEEVLTIQAFGNTIVCDFNPDVVEFPASLEVGTQWSTKSSCTASGAKLDYEFIGKIVGRSTVTVGGTAVKTWVVEATQSFSAGAQGSGTVTSTRYYDPSRGIDVFIKSSAKDNQGNEQTTRIRLASLTPKPL